MLQQSNMDHFTNLKYLYDFQQIQAWPAVLRQQGYTANSIKNMLLNVNLVIRHIKTVQPEMSGLSKEQFESILLQKKKLQKDNSQRIKAQQQTVKWKASNMIQKKPHAKLFKLLLGDLTSYLTILTSHHPVVLINLKKDKVQVAETDTQSRAMIWVDQYKTNQAYGNAILALLLTRNVFHIQDLCMKAMEQSSLKLSNQSSASEDEGGFPSMSDSSSKT
ncbi:hypothetical protein MHYP_G00104680 [Metynnis hypsauchen]